MTPTEKELFEMRLFDLGDIVEIDESGLIGEVVGFCVEEGCEDSYLVRYHDTGGNPKREWWPSSSLELDDPEDTESNVICFACEREARNATKH